MEGYKAILRERAGRGREAVRRLFASSLAWIRRQTGGLSPRRAAAAVVALSLWMGAGGMRASTAPMIPQGEMFGEVHWYAG